MTDQPESFILHYLRRIDTRLDAITQQVSELKDRFTTMEISMAGMRRENAADAESIARMQRSIDRLDDRVARIETRLDLRDDLPPTGHGAA